MVFSIGGFVSFLQKVQGFGRSFLFFSHIFSIVWKERLEQTPRCRCRRRDGGADEAKFNSPWYLDGLTREH